MNIIYKCPKCSDDLGMSGGQYCCWNSACDFRSYRHWIKPPHAIPDTEINSEISGLIGCCIHAATHGPFFVDSSNSKDPYWEYQTLLGFNIDEAKEIDKQWPDIDVNDVHISEFIGSCITWLLSYPHRCDDIWNDYIPVTKGELNTLLNDWKLKFLKCT